MKNLIFLITGAALLGSLGCTNMDQAQGGPQPGAAKLGLLLPMTGAMAGNAQGMNYAALMAISEINAAGGVNGQQLTSVVQDTKLDAGIGTLGARNLLAQDCLGIVGPAASSVLMAVAQNVTIPAGIPLCSPSATSPAITTLAGGHGTVWRTIASDAIQGVILANQIHALGVTRIAVIYVNNVYGAGLEQAFATQYQVLGGTLSAAVPYPNGQVIGFAPQVSQLFAPGVTPAVLIIGYATDSANITRDILAANPSPAPRLFGVDGNYASAFLANAASALAVGMCGTAPVPPASSANYLLFAQNYQNGVGSAPPLYASNAYDAVYLMALAMAAGKANSSQAIIANLGQVSSYSGHPNDVPVATDVQVNPGQFALGLQALKAGQHVKYSGASGQINFDGNGDVNSGTYVWWKVVAGSNGPEFSTDKLISFP